MVKAVIYSFPKPAHLLYPKLLRYYRFSKVMQAKLWFKLTQSHTNILTCGKHFHDSDKTKKDLSQCQMKLPRHHSWLHHVFLKKKQNFERTVS